VFEWTEGGRKCRGRSVAVAITCVVVVVVTKVFIVVDAGAIG
jgi:hypothetical protein